MRAASTSVLLLALLGCDSAERREGAAERVAARATGGAGGGAASVAAAPPAAAPHAAAAAPARATPHGCRVMSTTGAAQRSSGGAVRAGDRFLGSDWLELGKGTKLHLKHGESGREWTLQGPARVLPCVDGQEELIVAEGSVRAEPGIGVRPGAQVLIGTPFGSVRYGDAAAQLDVTSEALRLSVSSGDTWLRSPAAKEPETHVTRAKAAQRGRRERLQAEAAVAECERAARASESLAKSLVGPAAPGLGQRAAEHVRARELARARCADATAAVSQQASGSERQARLSELAALREVWRRVPAPGG
jgi:hypothetical protein